MRDDKAGATTLQAMREDYDWQAAFEYAGHESEGYTEGTPDLRRAHPTDQSVSLDPFSLGDVTHIEAASEGENDGDSWMALGQTKDGRWFLLDAWCDYTGWDCQAGGTTTVAASREELMAYGITPEERKRLYPSASAQEQQR